MNIRFMKLDDIDQVLNVEHHSFTLPWSRDSFVNELEKNHFATYIVLEEEPGQIVGYCGAWLILDEAHITNIAILPSHRGKGYGSILMKKMMDLAIEAGAHTMTLEVRVSNHVAQTLYRKYGFQDGGIRKYYYSDNGEDALVMWVKL